MQTGFKTRRGWIYKLPDPFRLTPWYPLGDDELCRLLGVSPRTAIRICQGERQLRECETGWLQWLVFGAIPDPDFARGRWYIQDGILRSHDHRLTVAAGEIAALSLFQQNRQNLFNDLAAARVRIQELESDLLQARNELPANVVRFPARARRGPDGAA